MLIHRPILGRNDKKVRLPRRMKAAAAAVLCGGLAFYAPHISVWAAEAAEAVQSAETVQSAEAAESGAKAMPEISMKVDYGYDNSAKGGRYLPIRVSIEGNGDEPLDGTLVVKTIESDGAVYEYDFPAELAAEAAPDASADIAADQSAHVIREYVPLGTRATELYVELSDAAGTVLAEQQVKLNVSWDVPELFIGVLSDSPQNLKYLDGVGINYGSMRTRTFNLEEEDFPEDEMGLGQLDMLVVNDYKLRKLSVEQTSAIMDWVESGGTLMLGTGERVDDTLGRFAPELLDDSYAAPNLHHIDLGESYPVKEEGAGMLAITCVDIPLHGGNVIVSSNGFALFTVAAKEQGLIGVAAFDLSEISQFCEQETSYVDYLLTGLIGESRIARLAEVIYNGNSQNYSAVQRLINTGNVEKLPNLPLYVGIIGIYLFLIGPGLYLFLKNRELQIYYRRGVMILSGVFAVCIYLLGSSTRLKTTFYTYAAIQDTTNNYVTDTTYLNIRNPYSCPFEVSLDPAYSVLPITKTQRNGNKEWTGKSSSKNYQIAIDRRDEELKIRGQNIESFSPKYFCLEKKTENTNEIGLTGQIDYFEGMVKGSVTNQFPYEVEDVAVIMYGTMIYVGNLKPGETRGLEDLQLLRFPLNNAGVVAKKITDANRFTQADIGSTEYLLTLERISLLNFYLDNYLTGYTADARVIAFSKEKQENIFLRENEPEIYGHTLLTSPVAVNTSLNSRLYRSVLMKTPKVVTGRYDTQANTMRGAEPLTLEYQLGADIRVESLTFEPISEEFLNGGQDTTIEVFKGSIYLYNHSTGNFDQVEMKNNTLNVEQLGPFLSPGNILTVRYVYEGTGGYNAVQLPMPMVAGRGI